MKGKIARNDFTKRTFKSYFCFQLFGRRTRNFTRNNGNYKEPRRRFSNNFENGDLYVDIKFVNRNYDESVSVYIREY